MGCCKSKVNKIITDSPFYSLDLSISAWVRESHGLFDYDNKHVGFQCLKITNTCIVCSEENILDGVSPLQAWTDPNLKKLFTLVFKNSRYWIYHSRDFNEEDMLMNPIDQTWISLREMCPQIFKAKYNRKLGYRLSKGDIIKFGRVRFRIKEVGSYKDKKSRRNKYDASLDVSMNEKLLRNYSQRKRGKNDTFSGEQSMFNQNAVYVDDFNQENIISKLDAVSSTSEK